MDKIQKLHFGIGEGLSNLIRDAFWFEQKFEWANDTLDCFQGINEEQKNRILTGDAYLKPIENGDSVQLIFEKDKDFKEKLAEHISFVKNRLEYLHKEKFDLETDKDKLMYGVLISKNKTEEDEGVILITKGITMATKQIEDFTRLIVYFNKLFGKTVKPELTVNIGGYEIPKPILEEYTEHVVKRLRNLMKNPMLAYAFDPLELVELEQKRKYLHDKILNAIGLKERTGEKYLEFYNALEKYMEKVGAGLGLI